MTRLAEFNGIVTFFDKLISVTKTPTKRNQVRKMKLLALEGHCSSYCCDFGIVVDERHRTQAGMEK